MAIHKLSDELNKKIVDTVAAAAMMATQQYITEQVQATAQQAALGVATDAASTAARQFCNDHVAETAQQVAGKMAALKYDNRLARIDTRCNLMADNLQRAGVADTLDQVKAMTSLRSAANQLANTWYTKQDFFFDQAVWLENGIKARQSAIQQAINAQPAKLDRFNQPAWFQKVYSTCKYTIPGSTPLQRVDVMWGALPEEQTCLWVASIAEVQWEVEQQPEHLLEAATLSAWTRTASTWSSSWRKTSH